MSDIPSFNLEDVVKAYPDAKFILTTRDPQSWLRSVTNTIGKAMIKVQQFPFSILRFFDYQLYTDLKMAESMRYVLFENGDATNHESALQRYNKQLSFHFCCRRRSLPIAWIRN